MGIFINLPEKAPGLRPLRSGLRQSPAGFELIGSSPVRSKFTHYLQAQIQTAERLRLDHIGLPVSSHQIESLFGLGKLHGTGEIKDANRIALRLPCLCRAPAREEAEQVVKISVAEKRQITGAFTSLVKQRRQVLRHPDRLESLGTEKGRTQFDLIASAKNRENNGEIFHLPVAYEKTHGLRPLCQTGRG